MCYNYSLNFSEDSLVYCFSTDHGVEYKAYFLPFVFSGVKLYHFGFNTEKVSLKKVYDKKIQATIVAIIMDFFKRTENALLIVCDTQDGRQLARKRLFDKWYRSDGINTLFEKNDFDNSENHFHASFFIKSDNPLRNHYRSIWQQWTSVICRD